MAGILLIDDAQVARMVIRTLLEDHGYRVCGEASNGREGVEKYSRLRPELVFCDVRMDEMTGTECIRAILALDPTAKIVACTAINDEYHLNELMRAGARGYIEKPIHGTKLLEVTEELIGKPGK